jgi:hypothetical protein
MLQGMQTVGTAFASKTKTKGRSDAHRRYTKVSYRRD